MITFESVDDATLTIHMDQNGKELLLRLLQHLNTPGDHDHLTTPSWSGHELSEEANTPAGKIIHMVTIGMTEPKRQTPDGA